jgi:glycosyltransferase involved in cell wall biosynthesis
MHLQDPDLDFVIPVLNESGNIELIVQSVEKVFSETKLELSLIFVDDGSIDDTWKEIEKARKKSNGQKLKSSCKVNIHGLRLLRNLGQMRAIEVGLSKSKSPFVIIMDGDLQHPPEVALELWNNRNIADTVAAKQDYRKEKFLKRTLSTFFYSVINFLSGEEFPRNVSDFRILSRGAIKVILSSNHPVKVIRFLVPRLGLQQSYINYSPRTRLDGTGSRYTFRKMFELALQSLAVSSTRLLSLSLWLCLGYFVFSLSVLIYAGYYLVTQSFSPGWISVIGTILTSFTLNFLILGITSVYLFQLISAQDAPSREYIKEII